MREARARLPAAGETSSSLSLSLMTSRKMKRSQDTRKDSGVFFSPMPMTTLPASRSRVASLLKSPSLETMQKPCTSPVYRRSMASMIRPMSEAFLPGVLLGCMTGVSE